MQQLQQQLQQLQQTQEQMQQQMQERMQQMQQQLLLLLTIVLESSRTRYVRARHIVASVSQRCTYTQLVLELLTCLMSLSLLCHFILGVTVVGNDNYNMCMHCNMMA